MLNSPTQAVQRGQQTVHWVLVMVVRITCISVNKVSKTSAKMYITNVLVKPLNHSLFHRNSWTFQHDHKPAHNVKIRQTWLSNTMACFIKTQDWPPMSPNLNPLIYKLWSDLKMDFSRRPVNLDSLKMYPTASSSHIPAGC